MIRRETIEKVFETARVEEVIGDFVQLKRSGSNYKGLSPFTEERTPSFMVSPVKQIWKDFSSGKGGNVVTFLMEHEHFTYPEAIRWLAKKYHIEVEETEPSNEQKEAANERESLYLINEYANTFFKNNLWETTEGQAIGLTYFKERGFSEATIKTFQLGYSPESWDAFSKQAIHDGYQLEYLEKSGLTIPGESRPIDRFRGRVIFPIFSMSGRTLGFGGRILNKELKTAKYLNSPESEVYHKSKVLYGLYQAKQAIAKENNCYLVEGYTDVIQLYQAGIQNVVASSGTALSEDQIRLISRLTQNITLLFDGDAAGLRAALRGVDMILEQGVNVKVCTFPEGEDPDSFAKKTAFTELKDYLENQSQDFIRFKASLLASSSGGDPIKKAETIRDIVQSISKIPDIIKREIYVQECSRLMDVSEEVIFNALSQTLAKQHKEQTQKKTSNTQPFEVVTESKKTVQKIDVKKEYELKILETLLLYGSEKVLFKEEIVAPDENGEMKVQTIAREIPVYQKIAFELQIDEIEFSNPVFKELYTSIIESFEENTDFENEIFIAQLESEKAKIVTDIFMDNERYRLHDWERRNIYVKEKKENLADFVEQTILNLRLLYVNELVKKLIENAGTTEEEKLNLLQNVQQYKTLEVALSRKLDTVVRRFF